MCEDHRPVAQDAWGARRGRGWKGRPGPDLGAPETKGAELYFGSNIEPLKGFKQTRNINRFVAL